MRISILILCMVVVACAQAPEPDVLSASQAVEGVCLGRYDRATEIVTLDAAPTDETGPGCVLDWSLDQGADAEKIRCDWDRCGDSGGYVCQDPETGLICLWQRGTTYFQCGRYCIQGGTSCYRCSSSGGF